MVVVAQLVRAPDCGSGGRGFETHLPPKKASYHYEAFLIRDQPLRNRDIYSLIKNKPNGNLCYFFLELFGNLP